MGRRARVGWLLALLVLTACTGGSTPRSSDLAIGFTGILPVAHRSPAPVISGSLLDGGRLAVSDWRGYVVLVNFWASWCTPCQQETTSLEQAYQETAGLGVRFVGVDVNDEAKDARSFRRAHHVAYPSLVDPSAALVARFPQLPSALPDSVLIDRSGRVAGTWIGPVTRDRLVAALRSLAPPPSRTTAAG